MQQRVKDLFESQYETDPFARELYKEVRKQAKKIDQIAELKGQKNLNEDQRKKLQNQDALVVNLEERVKVFELYKKIMNQENHQPNKAAAQNNKQQQPISCEHKVVECSILNTKEDVETASKETQHTVASSAKESQAQMKVVVSDSKSRVDTIQLVSSVFIIGANCAQIQNLVNQFGLQQVLSQNEIFIINKFFFDIMMDHNQSTLSSKLDKAVGELGKVLQENNNETIQGIAGELYTYADIKKICEKIMSNKQLANSMLFNSMLPIISTIPMNPHLPMDPAIMAPSQDMAPAMHAQQEVPRQQTPQKIVEQQREQTPPRQPVQTAQAEYEDEEEEEETPMGEPDQEEEKEQVQHQVEQEEDQRPEEQFGENPKETDTAEEPVEGVNRYYRPRGARGSYRQRGGHFHKEGGFQRGQYIQRGERGERGDRYHHRGGRGHFEGRGYNPSEGGRGRGGEGRSFQHHEGRGFQHHEGRGFRKQYDQRQTYAKRQQSDEDESRSSSREPQNMEEGGYQVVKSRHDKHRPAFSEQNGPRQARGGMRGRVRYTEGGRGGHHPEGGRGHFQEGGRGHHPEGGRGYHQEGGRGYFQEGGRGRGRGNFQKYREDHQEQEEEQE